MTLSDKTGQIDGRVWDADKARTLFDQLEEHRVVAVVARAEEYRGQKQLAVHQASLVDEQGPALLAEFVPTTGADLRKLKAQLEKVLLSITDEHLAKLVRWFFSRREFYDA
ncbi:MAG: hypothetical protein MJA84_02300, partial [Firmicutes bacterium]|nr:hypothetical protein [Bacillota bacterium]